MNKNEIKRIINEIEKAFEMPIKEVCYDKNERQRFVENVKRAENMNFYAICFLNKGTAIPFDIYPELFAMFEIEDKLFDDNDKRGWANQAAKEFIRKVPIDGSTIPMPNSKEHVIRYAKNKEKFTKILYDPEDTVELLCDLESGEKR